MRLGGNEFKFVRREPDAPARITAVVVTFLPHENDYFRDRLAVVRLSLASLVKHADLPIDLLVFDNGSCRRLVDYLIELKEAGVIRHLLLNSENVGLAGAYRMVADAAPGEIVAFANDDVFFFPGWLSPQVEILDTFPDVGLVSGAYLRATHPRSAALAVEKGLAVSTVPAPDEWLDEFCRDASYPSPETYLQSQARQGWTDREDRMASCNGSTAYAGGVCWQAVFKKETLRRLLPEHDSEAFLSYDGHFHSEILRRGFLRLSTTTRLVRHIGNVVTPEIAALATKSGIRAEPTLSISGPRTGRHPLMRFGVSRKPATLLYNYLYRVIKLS